MYINQNPTAIAGNDTLICYDQTLQLNGHAPFAESTLWETSGDGTFNNAVLLDAIYTPGSQDIINGTVLLTFSAFATEVCTGEDADVMQVIIDVCNTIDESSDQQIVSVSPNPSEGHIQLNILNPEQQKIRWEVRTLNGKSVKSYSQKAGQGDYNDELNLTRLSAGVYVLHVEIGNKEFTRKIVLRK